MILLCDHESGQCTAVTAAVVREPRACPSCGLWQRTEIAARICADPVHDADRAGGPATEPPADEVESRADIRAVLAWLLAEERGGATHVRIVDVRELLS